MICVNARKEFRMDECQKAAFVFAQAVAAMAEIEGMKAANASQAMKNDFPLYDEKKFMAVIDEYGLGYNTLMSELRGG